jgi:hypothetical protein
LLLILQRAAVQLQEVLVSSAGLAPMQFVANRWLAVDELDGSTYVTLTASGGKAAPTNKYMIQVNTQVRYPSYVSAVKTSDAYSKSV